MSKRATRHRPVMPDEILEWLCPQTGQTLVDGTLGGGGHTRLLAKAVGSEGRVIALDRDPAAIALAADALAGQPITLIESNFCELPEALEQIGVAEVDGVLLDVGLSSDQLADDERGFSFDSTGPLDLRFDPTSGEPAWRLLERLSSEHLANLIYEFGEERCSRRIAKTIIEKRRTNPVRTSADLARIVRRIVRSPMKIDPATRTFQALRIAVNDELKSLEIALRRMPDCLRMGGRLAVISFHSLEDRRVKQAFNEDPRWKVLTRRPLRPTDEEIAENPRSRSAKLRVAERREEGS